MRSRTWRSTCVLFIAGFMFAPSLHALDPAKSIFQLNCQNWSRFAGLPADKISAITQTKDGFIWLGSQNGLIRFDGIEFKSYPINLPTARGQEVERLSLAKDGRMWFSVLSGGYGSFDGRVFGTIPDERWTSPGINSHAILSATDGAVWTGSVSGWGRWVEGKPASTAFIEDNKSVFGLWEDATGRIWMGTPERGLFYWSDNEFKLFPDPELSKGLVQSVVVDRTGDLWVATLNGLYRYDSQFRRKEIIWPTTQINALLVDTHGVVWVGTDGLGLARYQYGKFTMFQKVDGLVSSSVTALFEDKEGSVWVGTTEGLSQLTDLKFPLYSEKEGLGTGTVIAVNPSHKGGLWLTTGSGATYFDLQNAKTTVIPSVFFGRAVRRVFEARNGEVYFVDGEKNIGILSGELPLKVIPNENWPETLAEDATSVLAGIGSSLMRIQNGQVTPYQFEGTPPLFHWINNLCVASDGAIWVAGNNGVFRVKDGKFKQWTTGDGLFSNTICYIMEDSDGSVWVGSTVGLVKIKGDHLSRIGVSDGLPDPRIFAIVADNLGYFWLDSGRGLLRVTRQELNDFTEGKTPQIHCETFDGLESVKFIDRTVQAYSACKTTDGRLWFPSPHGVVMVDPASYFINRVPPQVTIQSIRVQDRNLDQVRNATLQPGNRNLEFTFAALSYITPRKIKVRYQLEGFDSQWINGDARRSVTYNNLPRGRYVFRVQACNADGVWNTIGDEVAIELPPHFYERSWFYALIAFVILLALYGLYRWSVWQLHVKQKKLQADNDRLEAKAIERTKELAQSLSLLNASLESTADGILVVDPNGKKILQNKRTAELFKIPVEIAEGKDDPVQLKWVTNMVSQPEPFIQKIIHLYSHPEEISRDEVELKDGTILDRYSAPVLGKDGQRYGRIWTFRDITAIKRAQAELEDIHKQLMDASRRGGMAEIATNVLHNVGNVLNSVNVSTGLIVDNVKGSRIASLARVVTLMNEHAQDLGQFITSDVRGKNLPAFLAQLSEQLQADQQAVIGEVDSLQRNIEHIKEIVAMQQTYAKFGGVKELINVVDLVEDSLRMNAGAFTEQRVNVVREFKSTPVVDGEKHKILQILVNLLRNAKHACEDSDRPDRQVTVRIITETERIKIYVIDNGVGILAENLSRIFNHGFTTRKEGHGFGLHSGALAAKEMGGSLSAQSDGAGHGATFVLELPCPTTEKSNA